MMDSQVVRRFFLALIKCQGALVPLLSFHPARRGSLIAVISALNWRILQKNSYYAFGGALLIASIRTCSGTDLAGAFCAGPAGSGGCGNGACCCACCCGEAP